MGWALRDYQLEPIIWDGKEDCEHDFNIANPELIERKESSGGWVRPSREEYNKVGSEFKCIVCGKDFKGKHNQKFCSTKCLNTLSNEQRQNLIPKQQFCSKCNAWKGQLGLEPTFDLYIKHLVNIFDEVKRVLKKSGTCWVDIGDTYGQNWRGGINDTKDDYAKRKGNRYWQNEWGKGKIIANLPEKSLCLIPFRFALEMQKQGWIIRNVIIWHKPNCMPSSIKDRFTVDFEYVFFFVKNKKYFFERQFENYLSNDPRPSALERARILGYSTKERLYREKGNESMSGSRKPSYEIRNSRNISGRNKRTVWSITTQPFKDAHFAVFPEALVEIPIKAGCPENGIVLDPFIGSGTTGVVALKLNRNFIGIELNPKYVEMAYKRLKPYLEQTKLNEIK